MGLFTRKNKGCSCGEKCTPQNDTYEKGDIAVLGSGCPKCVELENRVLAVLKELNINKPVKHITDMADIASFGVMSTPALVIDGKVVASGKLLSQDEIKEFLTNES